MTEMNKGKTNPSQYPQGYSPSPTQTYAYSTSSGIVPVQQQSRLPNQAYPVLGTYSQVPAVSLGHFSTNHQAHPVHQNSHTPPIRSIESSVLGQQQQPSPPPDATHDMRNNTPNQGQGQHTMVGTTSQIQPFYGMYQTQGVQARPSMAQGNHHASYRSNQTHTSLAPNVRAMAYQQMPYQGNQPNVIYPQGLQRIPSFHQYTTQLVNTSGQAPSYIMQATQGMQGHQQIFYPSVQVPARTMPWVQAMANPIVQQHPYQQQPTNQHQHHHHPPQQHQQQQHAQPIQQQPPDQQQAQPVKEKRRPNAIAIVDPNTMKEIDVGVSDSSEKGGVENAGSKDTNSSSGDPAVIAVFASQVAKAAFDETPQSPTSVPQDHQPSPPNVVRTVLVTSESATSSSVVLLRPLDGDVSGKVIPAEMNQHQLSSVSDHGESRESAQTSPVPPLTPGSMADLGDQHMHTGGMHYPPPPIIASPPPVLAPAGFVVQHVLPVAPPLQVAQRQLPTVSTVRSRPSSTSEDGPPVKPLMDPPSIAAAAEIGNAPMQTDATSVLLSYAPPRKLSPKQGGENFMSYSSVPGVLNAASVEFQPRYSNVPVPTSLPAGGPPDSIAEVKAGDPSSSPSEFSNQNGEVSSSDKESIADDARSSSQKAKRPPPKSKDATDSGAAPVAVAGITASSKDSAAQLPPPPVSKPGLPPQGVSAAAAKAPIPPFSSALAAPLLAATDTSKPPPPTQPAAQLPPPAPITTAVVIKELSPEATVPASSASTPEVSPDVRKEESKHAVEDVERQAETVPLLSEPSHPVATEEAPAAAPEVSATDSGMPPQQQSVADATPASAQPSDSIAKLPVIDDAMPPEAVVTPEMQPRASVLVELDYGETQWSPSNPSGEKKYDRNFLLRLMDAPQSKEVPADLQMPEIVLKTTNDSKMRIQSRSMGAPDFTYFSRPPYANFAGARGSNDFTPAFLNNQRGGNMAGMSFPSQYPPPYMVKRPSQQGRIQSKPFKVLDIQLNVPLKELHTVENAWRPGVMQHSQENVDEAEKASRDLCKKVRGILNRLTPQNFDNLLAEFVTLPIKTHDNLTKVIGLCFEKATDEPIYSEFYGKMCQKLQKVSITESSDGGKDSNFRKILLDKCQFEFESDTKVTLGFEEKMKEVNAITDVEKQKEAKLELEEEMRRARVKNVGLMKFIGELYKLRMLNNNIMLACINALLEKSDEESLECVCKLLSTVGAILENSLREMNTKDHSRSNLPGNLDQVFNMLRSLSKNKSNSSRIRFMIQDILELRDNRHWLPRKGTSTNPKKIQEVHDEDAAMKLREQAALMRHETEKRQMEAKDRSKQRGGGSMHNKDSWNVVQPQKAINTKPVLDSQKRTINKMDEQNIVLRPGAGGMKMWGQGAVGMSSNMPFDSSIPTIANRYNALTSKPGMAPSDSSGSSSRHSQRLGGLQNGKPSDADRDRRVIPNRPQLNQSRPESQSPKKSPPVEDNKVDKLDFKGPENLDDEAIDKVTKDILDEYIECGLGLDAEANIRERFSQAHMSDFVNRCFNHAIDGKPAGRQAAGRLFRDLVKQGALTSQQFKTGICEIIEGGDELAIDVPHIWECIGQILAPLFESLVFTFAFILDCVDCGNPANKSKVIGHMLHTLTKGNMPELRIYELVSKSCVDLSSILLPGEDLSKFLDRHEIGFLSAIAGGSSQSCSSPQVNWDDIRTSLITLLIESNKSLDRVFDWIEENVGPSNTKDPLFIRTLSIAIIESVLGEPPKYAPQEVDFMTRCDVLKKYIDNDSTLDVYCIYGLQALASKLEFPIGFFPSVCSLLYDHKVIPAEGFRTWRDSNDEPLLKGVAVSSMKQFFENLEDQDEDES